MNAESRFWNKVNRDAEVACWLWTGCVTPKGYGLFDAGKLTLTHRHAWALSCGEVPVGMQVLHKCDVRACVRPDHLFLGTNADNVKDKMSKGRHRFNVGEGMHNAKLTEDKVRYIRADTREQKFIAADYGIDQAVVSRVKSGKAWKHVKER